MPDPAPDGIPRRALENGVHLAVLWAFAVVQPLLDILGRNPTFFVVRDSTSRDIVLVVLALTLVPPAVMALLELVAGLVDRRVLQVLHLVFVGALVSVFALTVLTKLETPAGLAAVAIAIAAGTAGALVYARVRATRSFLTLLAPVPLVFVALFLFHSPASKLVRAGQPEARAATVPVAAVRNQAPVVVILFDEFSTVALMDGREQIDARRYPNFASLAGDATWYRNHSTMFWLSEGSVPAILTGRLPDAKKAPVLADYPDNLFTLLGETRRIDAIESITRICPASLCHATRTAQAVSRGESGALTSDLGVVYLHLLLPDPYAGHVPPIDGSWGNFGGKEKVERELVSSNAADIPACGRSICEFADSITAGGKPALYFLDTSLPHTPYIYLPSGRRYAVDARVLRGLDNGFWRDSWPTEQSQQRYLVQTGYTDLALGHILKKLRSTGLYDKALIVVSADHGVSFDPGGRRRSPTATNLDDIAFVPLLIKLPGQTRGRVDDSLTRSIDILPTIADAVGLTPPWHVDGRSLLGRGLPAGGTVTVLMDGGSVSAPLSSLRAQRSRTLAHQVAEFGTGPFSAVYRIGPNRTLLGRSISGIPVRQAPGPGVDLVDGALLNNVDLDSSLLPSFIEGTLKHGPQLELAVAVNGRIAAVTRTFEQFGQRRFSAFVPESALRQGSNTVGVYAVRHAATGLVLDEFRSSHRELGLETRNGVEVISSPDGRAVKVSKGAPAGTVRAEARSTGYVFSGQAAAASKAPADSVAVFADSRAIFVGRVSTLRPQKLLGDASLGKLGYAFELPRSFLPGVGSDVRLRVFAIRFGVASELDYAEDYPWLHGPPSG